MSIPDLSPFIQTFLGAVSGAGAAFAFQNRKEKRKEIEQNKALVNFSLMSLSCNLENLICFKEQILLPLVNETTQVKSLPGISKFLETGVPEGRIDLGRLSFLISLNEKPGFLPFPDLEKLINLSQKHPNILRLCQRVNEHLNQIQETIEIQNKNIQKFVDSKPPDIQILSLLISLSEKLETVTNNALFFIMKSRSLIYKICDETFPEKRKGISEFKISEKHKHILPPDDLIKGY